MREDLSRNLGALSFVVWPRAWACVACFYLVPKQGEEGEGQQVAADLVGPGCNTPQNATAHVASYCVPFGEEAPPPPPNADAHVLGCSKTRRTRKT
uniref:EC48 protein n=1 Tax=Colletotrichum higginsianum TaxID=80884 RepID=I2G7C7_9PEZI|nr:EC48 protein [Colletotrichum higginsianum]